MLAPCPHCGATVAQADPDAEAVYCPRSQGGCGAFGPTVDYGEELSHEEWLAAVEEAWNVGVRSARNSGAALLHGRYEWVYAYDRGHKFWYLGVQLFCEQSTGALAQKLRDVADNPHTKRDVARAAIEAAYALDVLDGADGAAQFVRQCVEDQPVALVVGVGVLRARK